MFLEETIESLDTEEDSGLSNDEPDQLPNPGNLANKLADLSASMSKNKLNGTPNDSRRKGRGRMESEWVGGGFMVELLNVRWVVPLTRGGEWMADGGEHSQIDSFFLQPVQVAVVAVSPHQGNHTFQQAVQQLALPLQPPDGRQGTEELDFSLVSKVLPLLYLGLRGFPSLTVTQGTSLKADHFFGVLCHTARAHYSILGVLIDSRPVLDALGSVGVTQSTQAFLVVVVCWGETRNHQGACVSSKGVLQQPGQLGVPHWQRCRSMDNTVLEPRAFSLSFRGRHLTTTFTDSDPMTHRPLHSRLAAWTGNA
ncbi:hypothetical protein INR49_014090 [Caranx melampygus]|nr:hypothetical protein INR49_014090 [Caranx melampygus]